MPVKPKRAKPTVAKRAAKRVPVKPKVAKPKAGGSRTDPAVVAFLQGLDAKTKPIVEGARKIILEVSGEIREAIKWNAPSFVTSDHFATFNLHGGRVRLIFHTGAKVRETAVAGIKIADPEGLLEWVAKDRCILTLADAEDLMAKRAALSAIVRQWIAQMPA